MAEQEIQSLEKPLIYENICEKSRIAELC